MKASALAIAALLITATAVNAAAPNPAQPYSGTDVKPYDWLAGAGMEGLSEYQAALVLNSQPALPMTLDEVTTLVNVSFDGLTFVYDYKLTVSFDPGFDIGEIKTEQLTIYCEALSYLAKPGELDALRYRYLTSDGKTLAFDVTAADCGIA
jgi:hypothetical protein